MVGNEVEAVALKHQGSNSSGRRTFSKQPARNVVTLEVEGIAPIRSEKPLLVEDWTMELTKPPGSDEKLFTFTLSGSITGPDGEGSSDVRFVSKSGRIAFTPEDWDAHYALTLAGMKPFPEKFTAKWSVVPRFVDHFVTPGLQGSGQETIVTLALGFTNTKHTLEIFGSLEIPIAALRVYRPALAAKTN